MFFKTVFVGLIAGSASFAEEGFTDIFNGKDFAGWYVKIRGEDDTVAKQVFKVNEQGWIHVFGEPFKDGHELDTGKNDTHGMIYSKKTYSRFILKFDYKWGKKRVNNFGKYQYDAGMYYHVYDDRIWPGGVEYQIRYDHLKNKNHTGDFWAAGKSRFQWYADKNKHYLSAEDGGELEKMRSGEHLAKAGASFHGLNDQWNQCELIVMGDKFAIHKLNGEIVNVAKDLNVSEGKIGFQSETAEIFYRNIRVKEFETDLLIELFLKAPLVDE